MQVSITMYQLTMASAGKWRYTRYNPEVRRKSCVENYCFFALRYLWRYGRKLEYKSSAAMCNRIVPPPPSQEDWLHWSYIMK
jgi:hypothetical protein